MTGWLGFWIGAWLCLGIVCVGSAFVDALIREAILERQRDYRDAQTISQLLSWHRKLENRVRSLEVTTARRRQKADALPGHSPGHSENDTEDSK